eukprot:TRINITY_DN81112_c0_g1_i1.p1 TRINITY_DN81112_c0_g1~~TRINITY_DN81112_c0_g1_i1.p1  ORF type:complete len:201 (-),score=54.32 TRINITY_DN81112_c0_g1_i1:121-723(-)
MMAMTNENISPLVMKRIMKELRDLIKDPVDGILVRTCEDRISEIEADIMGPEGTPFEGGKFKMKLYLESDFPQAPPRGVFITRIFHPNISAAGDICVNTLKKDWSPDLGIKHILMVVRCLLIAPNPESALNEEAGMMLLENYDEYFDRAKLMTKIHASASTSGVEAKEKVGEGPEDSSTDKKKKKKSTKKTDKKRSLKRL